MDQSTTTTILAIWGAALSTFAVGWQFFRDISQRARLRLSCYVAMKVYDDHIDKKEHLVFHVTNIGKEPVMLHSIGGKLKGKTNFMIKTGQELPMMLKPGEYYMNYMLSPDSFNEDTRALFASDTISREWKLSSRRFRNLKKEILKKRKKS